MPRPKKKNPLPPTRKLVTIDWKEVDKSLEAGCSGTEVAASLGCSPETLYERCVLEKGSLFSAYLQQKRQKGDSNLRNWQHELAAKKDKTMLVWLGKQRLNQTEKHNIEVAPMTFNIHIQEVPK